MRRFSLIVLGAVVLCRQGADATIELPDLPYGESDLEPYISSEVRFRRLPPTERYDAPYIIPPAVEEVS